MGLIYSFVARRAFPFDVPPVCLPTVRRGVGFDDGLARVWFGGSRSWTETYVLNWRLKPTHLRSKGDTLPSG
jgi:hypothetical protein